MKRVLLINAPAEHIKERHYEQPDMPRIGLAYLASYLLASGIECEVIDAKYEKLNKREVTEIIIKKAPDAIGFTAMTTEIIDSAHLASKIKKELPDAVIIVGGPHASALPQETLKEFLAFDIVCVGEGERTLKELTDVLAQKKHLSDVAGIAYREKGNIVVNKTRPFIENLDDLPMPAWHLFSPAKKYPLLGSRGCPFRCNFCMRVLGDRIRFRSPELVVKEMKKLYETYNPTLFEFYDETFGVNKEKTMMLLEGIIKEGLNKKVKWHMQTRVDVVGEDLLSKMKEAGCEWVGFGIESGNEDILKATSKNITKEKIRKAISIAKKIHLQTGSFFILGHPNETEDTIRDTIDFALELNTETVSFGMMTPYPGTEIANLAAKGKGDYRLLSRNWSDYNKQTSNVLELKHVKKDMLKKYQLTAYMKFYLLRFSVAKIKSLLSFINFRSLLSIFLKRIFDKKRV